MHRPLASSLASLACTALACTALACSASPARAQCDLSTLYAWTTWAAENTVCYFDLDATRAVNIAGLSINTGTPVGTPIAIEMYVRTGSYVGNTGSPLGWSLAAAGTGVAAALDTPSRCSLVAPVLLGPGRHGIGVRYLNCTNLHTRGNGANQLYSGALYSLSLGALGEAGFRNWFLPDRVWNGTIHCAEAPGLYAAFTATPTTGATPLFVRFTDRSSTSDPSGVQTWAWDFDGDAIVDSNARHPSFTYQSCGSYAVALTVTDTQHSAVSVTVEDFISADPQLGITADFTASVTSGRAPLTVSFTDTSAGGPIAWSWDLDGDGVADSTARHPLFTYTAGGRYTVTLRAANACFADTETKVAVIDVAGAGANRAADLLAYPFNEVRGDTVANVATAATFPALGRLLHSSWQGDPGSGRDRFDANEPGFGCLRAGALTGVDSGRPFSHSGALTCMWWMRRAPSSTTSNPLGYVFSDNSFRIIVASIAGTGISFRGSLLGNVDLPGNVIGTPGWQHFALVIDDAVGRWIWYWNGAVASTGTFYPRTFFYGGVLPLQIGMGAGSAFLSQHWDVDDFRMYGAALSFGDVIACMSGETASAAAFDSGCAGPSGTPVLSATQPPRARNASFALALSNAEAARPAALLLGTSAHLGGVLPFDLQGLLGAGCSLGVQPEIAFPFFTANGSAQFSLPIPADPSIHASNGIHVYAQAIVLGTTGAVTNSLDQSVQID